ncbi:MAG: chemotaxis response regulator protein-glutamate methylesterase [Burkholderiales bacterium]|nr:chemotaxis response regulator protein-glutamate methylesterase [Burkholderiales bacterium]
MAIRAFVIDDSAVVRKHLTETLAAGGIQVIGSAADPLFAWTKLNADWPDVVVLDVEMPRMDGISFLRKLMAERPTPVVMCSTLTERGCETTMQALAAGAVAFITKPKAGLKDFLTDRSNGLVEAVRSAARANLRAMPRPAATPVARAAGLSPPPPSGALAETTDRVVAIGISTGGVQSIEVVLRELDRTSPGIVMVQHMPERFTASLAARLNSVLDLEVLEARDGDRVLNGRVLIAPGGKHMQLRRSGAQYLVEVKDGPLINHHRPSVDVLFRSVAQCAGRNALGIIMTGMGDDGARGLRDMREAGALTAAQDEASCVVFGMPAEAIKLGAAMDVVPLQGLAGWIRQCAARPAPR